MAASNAIQQQICDAIDIIINKRVANLQFDKTVRATIVSVEDQSIGKYKVKYQDSVFFAYSDPDKTYKKGAQVYVQIPSNDYNKPKLIIGSVKKIGTEYLTAVSAKDRVTEIGKNILTTNKNVNFCSYKTTTNELLGDEIRLDTKDLAAYKKEASYFLIGMTVRTNLPTEQQVGGGNYGIIVTTQEYNTGYKNHTVQSDQDKITRTYVLDVNNMLGQPYKFYLAEKQYALFAIDGKNLEKITKITAFCKGFPQQRNGQPDDIFLSDFSITFADVLPEEELNSSSLRILTPNGSYYRSQNDDGIFLEAQVKIKGRKVNYNQQKIDFYWFVKDTRITSSEKYYSPYAGDGWKCLNQLQDAAHHWFTPQGYRKNIPITLSPSAETTFKCVGVYEDITLNSTIKLTNDYSSNTVTITSSAGTQFHFDTGRTTLTCNVTSKSDPQSSLTYYWAYRTSENPFQTISTRTKSLNNIPIATSTNYITYECSVYNNSGIIGTAQITLVNGIPENEYTLIIKNGSQIFKYDEYGVSPVSRSAEPKDRITINNLSFEIYDDQGNLATPIDDVEKIKRCQVKWIWPDTQNTLLQNQPSYNGELKTQTIYNRITNVPHTRTILPNIANLYFTIKNNYDLDLLDNQIQLQVNFEGHNLVASTNFTFVKEGQSGTNGTKYVARIIPREVEDTPLYEKIYVEGKKLIGMYKTTSRKYEANKDAYTTIEEYVFKEITSSNPLRSQLWDGNDTALYDSSRTSGNIQGELTWELVDVGVKRNNHNISIDKVSGDITIANTFQNNSASIIKTTFSSSHLSELARKYYATYPMIIVNKRLTNTYHPIVVGGFDQCMYQSDGTRGAFKTKPFTFKLFDGNKEKVVVENSVIWTPSWTGQSITGNNVTIEPPSYYNSESVNNYIKVTYANNAYTIILPVYLYLNQYGMAAMNDWDGTSIKINNTGDQYILAPQIGAGIKDNTNAFTGITMGKSFNANDSGKTQIGLMGFSKGRRSIFLDADTGNASFGIPGTGQVIISPDNYGLAPGGSLYSWNYYKDYDKEGKPSVSWSTADIEQSRESKGMLIDLVTPKIRFGNGNFEVNKNGEITARGNGNIAGWKIDDENIYGSNQTIYLNSNPSASTRNSYNASTTNGPRLYGQRNRNQKHDTLISTSSGFYLGSDGLSIGSKFLAAWDGTVLIGTGATTSVANGVDNTKCWTINGNADRSYISFKRNTAVPLLYDEDEKTWNNSFSGKKGSVYLGTDGIRLGDKFAVDNNGNTILQNLYARNSGNIAGWQINKDELKSHKGNIILNTNGQIIVGEDQDIVIDEDGFITVGDEEEIKINGDGTIKIKGTGKISSNNWQIDGNGYAKFTNVDITSDHNSTLNWGNNFSVTTDGQINAIAGKIGNWELSANGFSGIEGKFSVNTNDGIKFGDGFSIGKDGDGTIGGCLLSGGQLYANGLRLQGSTVGWAPISGIFCNLALSADKRSYTGVLTEGTSVTLSGDPISGYTASLNPSTVTVQAITDVYWAYTEKTINVLGDVGENIHKKGKIPTVTPE